jgi:hypothetical protein
MVNLRKRAVVNYNVDEYYEKIFEDCDEEVKEGVLYYKGIKRGLNMLEKLSEDVVLLLEVLDDIEREYVKRTMIKKLIEFQETKPNYDWSKYLKLLGACKCGEKVSIILEDECGCCFVERWMSKN